MNFADPSNESTPESTPSEEPQVSDDDLALDPTLMAAGKKKNNSMFILFGLLVVAGGVIWFMYFRGSPQAAQAAAPEGSGSADVQKFLDSGNINLMKQTLKNTEKVVQQFRSYPAQTQVPLASLHSNPFRELEPKADVPDRPKDDDQEARDHGKALAAVAELHLQSIMRGSKYRSCMINNVLYKENQQVGIFTIAKVDTATVTVECGKYRFELTMQK